MTTASGKICADRLPTRTSESRTTLDTIKAILYLRESLVIVAPLLVSFACIPYFECVHILGTIATDHPELRYFPASIHGHFCNELRAHFSSQDCRCAAYFRKMSPSRDGPD